MILMHCLRAVPVLAVLVIVTGAASAAAGFDLYRQGLDTASGHLRMAWSYARTGNGDLAAMEADGFTAAWQVVAAAVKAAPAKAGGVPALTVMIEQVGRLGAEALAHIEAARLEEAQHSLTAARTAIRNAHRAIGLETFADCIWDANRTGDRLWRHIRERPDVAQPEVAREVAAQAAAYAGALGACDRAAPPEVAKAPEFRRLMDGALASLAVAGRAAKDGDGGLLHRYLIEIISLDRLLFFRFG